MSASTTTNERPILFSGPMVRAILDGRKTQTRRMVKVPGLDFIGAGGRTGEDWDDPGCWGWEDPENPSHFGVLSREPEDGDWSIRCPYGKPGDRLWVRETWRPKSWSAEDGWGEIEYRDGHVRHAEGPWSFTRMFPFDMPANRWRPSIYMPRWASRLTLEITGVRVERLQEITEEDAKAEGVGPGFMPNASGSTSFVGHRPMFACVWREINGKGSWDGNPWVWVIEFRRASDGGR